MTTLQKMRFGVSGLDCPAEEKLIRNRLASVTGINDLEFNFIRQELVVTHSSIQADLITQALAELGMQATLKTSNSDNKKINTFKTPYKQWVVLIVAGILALTAEIYAYITGTEQSIEVVLSSLIAIALSGTPTFKKGWLALRTFTLNINFLMMIAIAGALLIGEWPEAAMVTVLFALAELIERYSLDKARHAIEGLMEMAPDEANCKLAHTGNWEVKPVADIQLNDIIWVKPGERIPLDGVVLKGQTTVNQAPVTGESLPVEKKEGDTVFAGTLNELGSFEFTVTTRAENTLLAKIIQVVEKAQAQRAPTQRFVDQFAKFYTPLMVALALMIALLPPLIGGMPFYPWIYKALVLLVIACPCALVISTPITIVSGLAAAAQHGLLIKGGIYLEEGHRLKVIAFDKTGTLTVGKPSVTNILALKGNEIELLKIAASLDSSSEHPVARAVVNEWNHKQSSAPLLPVSQFEAILGRGVTAHINGQRYYVGNHQLAEDNKVCNPTIEAMLHNLEQEGKTTLLVTTEQEVLGILAVADTVRKSSQAALAKIHELGIKTLMLTGDNAVTANAISQRVGIDLVKANLLPEEKLAVIEELRQHYNHVGMVGDGINDAPALAKASIGFAMGAEGTDTALETADVVLMEDNLNKLPLFITLSRKTFQILIQNISFSITLKAIFFVLALLGMATLWMAVFADMGASLIVVFNGLRLLNYKSKVACCAH